MTLIYSKDFIKAAKLVPKPAQKKLAILLEILREDSFNQKLHTKPLVGPLKGYYSFRITRDWRAIFNFIDSQKIFLIDVAHRKDIYK